MEGGRMSKQLLFSITRKDLVVEYFSGTGAGGQYRNKHQNCVRIKHPESGTLVTGQSHRERLANMKEALNNLVADPKFRIWHTGRVWQALSGKSIDDAVDEAMMPENLVIEYCGEDRKWQLWNQNSK